MSAVLGAFFALSVVSDTFLMVGVFVLFLLLSTTTPLLLLDDIFDKLDAQRVESIVQLVSGDNFGQIFITDTNRDHLDKILSKSDGEYKIFTVEGGDIELTNNS